MPPARLLLLLAPAALLWPALAAAAPGQRETAPSAEPPVVLVVLDELPVSSLLDGRGRVHSRRYPSFARLAADATWYRDTTAVHGDTPYALPAILDGRMPERDRLPTAADHGQSIFTLLAGRYELHVREDATSVCPPDLCPDSLAAFGVAGGPTWDELGISYLDLVSGDRTARRGWVHGNLAEGRLQRFREFVAEIEAGPRPRLHVLHTLLPHVPYQFLPSGRAYRREPGEDIPGLNSPRGYGVRWLQRQAYQRHLLQLGSVDRLLGLLLDRLRETGLYDRALVALVADHGISFRRGHSRRLLRPGNVAELAPVPFLLKAPGQRRGRISDKPLRTVDVLPTIADLLGVRIPWRVDGRSALAPTGPAQRSREMIGKRFGYTVRIDGPRFEAARRAALRRQLRLFGDGVHALGPHSELVGRRVAELYPTPPPLEARLNRRARLRVVDAAPAPVPAHLTGAVVGGRARGGRRVAVALDGRIAATGVTFSLPGMRGEQFSLMVPERLLSPGRHTVRLLWLPRGRYS